jgi:hypothetical protein
MGRDGAGMGGAVGVELGWLGQDGGGDVVYVGIEDDLEELRVGGGDK